MSPDTVAYATPTFTRPTSKQVGMAVASMVLGILSILIGWIPIVGWFLGSIMALLAIILGAIAMSNANKRPAEFGGKGMAVTGLVLGIISIGLAILFWVMVGSFIAAFA